MATHAPARLTRARRAELLRGIYAILDDGDRTLELAAAVIAAGVRVVQYRAKNGIDAERLRRLRDATRASDALLIVNDRWRAALAFDCDGVHLGPGDEGFAQPDFVRAAMPERLIGLSCGTLEEIARAHSARIDYLGIGSVFATRSKPDAGPPLGVEALRRLAARTNLPVAAIGGICADNLGEIRATGVAMAAVISAISSAADPRAAAAGLVARWNLG